MGQINGKIARGERRPHGSVPPACWADFDFKLVGALDRVHHVASAAGVEDGCGVGLVIDHDVPKGVVRAVKKS